MIEQFQQNVRDNISQERRRLSWSYGKLSRMVTRAGLQMERNVPWDIEQGTYFVTLEELAVFARVFQRPMEYFFLDPRLHIKFGETEIEKLARALFDMFSTKHEDWDPDAWIPMAEDLAPTVESIFEESLQSQPIPA
jgi:hypothetical protein